MLGLLIMVDDNVVNYNVEINSEEKYAQLNE